MEIPAIHPRLPLRLVAATTVAANLLAATVAADAQERVPPANKPIAVAADARERVPPANKPIAIAADAQERVPPANKAHAVAADAQERARKVDESDQVLNVVRPLATLRFPGGGIDHPAFAGDTVVAVSGWSREDGLETFNLSPRDGLRFAGRIGARGYAVANPLPAGRFALFPNLVSIGVADLSDPAAPALAAQLARPSGSAVRVAPDRSRVFVQTSAGVLVYASDPRLQDGIPVVREFHPGAKLDDFARQEKDPRAAFLPPAFAARAAFDGDRAVAIDAAASSLALFSLDGTNAAEVASTPLLMSLGAIAAKDGTAYILSPSRRQALLTLDARLPGPTNRTFRASLVGPEFARTNTFMTIGMQKGGTVIRAGDILFRDDGTARLAADGAASPVSEPALSVANASIDGTRIALAQSRRCRVLDFSRFPKLDVVCDFAPTGLVHITGCHLRGDDLFVTWLEKEKPNHDFIYRQPTNAVAAYVDLRQARDGLVRDAVSTARIPAAVSCLLVGDRWLYAPGYKRGFAVVDAADPRHLRLVSTPHLLASGSYKVKAFGGRVFCQDGRRILELDTSEPTAPAIARVFARGKPGAPGYDDFTVDGGKLYALAHSSLDLFDIADGGEPTACAAPFDEDAATVVDAPLPDLACTNAPPSPPSERTATVLDAARGIAFFTVPPARQKAAAIVAADISAPAAPRPLAAVALTSRILSLAVDPPRRLLAAADGRAARLFRYGGDGALAPVRDIPLSDDPLRGPQGLAFAADGTLFAACGLDGLRTLSPATGQVRPVSGDWAFDGLFAAGLTVEGDDLLVAFGHAGLAELHLHPAGTDAQRALSRCLLTPVPGGDVTAAIRAEGTLFVSAGLVPLFARGRTACGGSFHNYFSAYALDLADAGDGTLAVADGEGMLLLYSATETDGEGAPRLLGELPPGRTGSPAVFGSSLAAIPGLVFLNDPGAGLRVVDVSNPARPRQIARLRPTQAGNGK